VGYLDTVNRTKVTPELLLEVVQTHTAMAPEDRPVFEARAIRIFELLKRKGVRGRRMTALAEAIDFRLSALARLQRDAVLRGWSVPTEDPGAISIAFDALKIAADEPLIENAEKRAAFDPDSFRRRLLAITEPDGRA
jgi:hypothetical protein